MASRRRQRFDAALAAEPVDRQVLAELTWSGVPDSLSRIEVWQLLLGYRPVARERQSEALRRKRQEYGELRRSFYDSSPAVARAAAEAAGEGLSAECVDGEASLLRQIRKDLPRTQLRSKVRGTASRSGGASPGPLLEHPRIQGLMERVLFVWAVRQPASGYVQGLNDVLLPLMVVSLSDRSGQPPDRIGADVLESLSDEDLGEVEADCYWCASKILSEILDHYTHNFPGIQRMAAHLREILMRIDAPLVSHLEAQNINLFQTCFQWIACLMVRELPIACCVRLWDTFIAESAVTAMGHRAGNGDCRSAGFEVFLVYFLACFTAYFSPRLQAMDLEAISQFLAKAPDAHGRLQ